ncbi:hypothetical protein [Listeria monocytogenes]|uniref:hypothetical protein n=1 Tax=Listeria monocytogenes TaxID=1639 RepID=UPI0011EB8EC2|nr:hypothetical protein [Listeria monocytogenes]MCD2222829.1 hypothetical protein [Listeria monocytogenes]TYW24664.1 hypothetical protein FZ082_12870 [Listeria monocytogenes]
MSISLSEVLIQARGLGVFLTLAHQNRHQLPQNIKMAIDPNCNNKICFGLDMTDASEMANQSPELTSEDFYCLPQYHIYTRLHNDERSIGWRLGKTFPLPPRTKRYEHLVAQNLMKYSWPISKIEAEFIEAVHGNSTNCMRYKSKNASQIIGRRKKDN